MAKTEAWIIVKILDHTRAWNNESIRWDDLANATTFYSQGHLLPQGGKWMAKLNNPNYDWAEGALVSP